MSSLASVSPPEKQEASPSAKISKNLGLNLNFTPEPISDPVIANDSLYSFRPTGDGSKPEDPNPAQTLSGAAEAILKEDFLDLESLLNVYSRNKPATDSSANEHEYQNYSYAGRNYSIPASYNFSQAANHHVGAPSYSGIDYTKPLNQDYSGLGSFEINNAGIKVESTTSYGTTPVENLKEKKGAVFDFKLYDSPALNIVEKVSLV